MKMYFINFDLWDAAKTFNKFYSGIHTFDLDANNLDDVVRQIIRDAFPGINSSMVIFNIKALNNISVK